jgi:hypothetical protein
MAENQKKNVREGRSKYFSYVQSEMDTASNVEKYDEDPNWTEVKQFHYQCLKYATAYTATVMKRMATERPEFFEEAGMS